MSSFSIREHAPSILVATLGTLFGVGLLQATAYLTVLFGDTTTAVSAAMTVLALVFLGISVYVGAVVVANTFATIVAGRVRVIALQRLIGAEARVLRRSVSNEGILVGVVGAVIGTALGIGLSNALLAVGKNSGVMPQGVYPVVAGTIWIPIVAVVATTWAASVVGSRAVLKVTPIQALASARALEPDARDGRGGRAAVSIALVSVGAALLLGGILIGLKAPIGMLVAMFGGFLSFAGVIVGASRIMPALLRLVGRALGRSVPARVAASNALRYPTRSGRTTIALVIGVTLITTFSVAGATYQNMVLAAVDTARQAEMVNQALSVTIGVLVALIGFSAVIAAVGMVNNLSLNVLQRTREIGLLRALGLTSRQVRWMILAESVQTSVTAIGFGLLLGIVYGWAGAQSLLASVVKSGIVVPTVPWQLVVSVAGAALALAVVASLAPARRATTISPVIALAAD